MVLLTQIQIIQAFYTYYNQTSNGCDSIVFLNLTIDSIQITSTQSNYNTYGVSCNGDTNGYIDISVQGGTSPYSFNWNNGATTEDLNSIGAGTYILTSTDVNGCTTNQTVIITELTYLLVTTPLLIGMDIKFSVTEETMVQ